MTALTFDFARTLARTGSRATRSSSRTLDHDANVRPWMLAAQAAGATVRFAAFDPATGELTADDVAAVLSDRTRLVALTGASNLIGTRPPLAADRRPGARGRRAALRRRGAPGRARPGRRRRAGRGPVRLLAVQVPRPALRHRRRAARTCSRRLRPDKLTASTDAVPERFELGHPAVRAAGRHHRGDRLPRRARRREPGPDAAGCRTGWLPSSATRTGCGSRRRGRAGRAARRDAALAGRAPHPDPAGHLRRPRRRRRLPLPGRPRAQRPGRARSTRWARPRRSAWASPAGCGSAWRPYTDADDVQRLLDGLARVPGDLSGAGVSRPAAAPARNRQSWVVARGPTGSLNEPLASPPDQACPSPLDQPALQHGAAARGVPAGHRAVRPPVVVVVVRDADHPPRVVRRRWPRPTPRATGR